MTRAAFIIGLALIVLFSLSVAGDPPELLVEATPAKQPHCLLPNPPLLAPALPVRRKPRNIA